VLEERSERQPTTTTYNTLLKAEGWRERCQQLEQPVQSAILFSIKEKKKEKGNKSNGSFLHHIGREKEKEKVLLLQVK
jgi:hypothetical protein